MSEQRAWSISYCAAALELAIGNAGYGSYVTASQCTMAANLVVNAVVADRAKHNQQQHKTGA